ncbi:MAG: substrate-binding domain-containing protein [Pedobacter sp.]|jgi:LacI family transcriptional regulator
MLKKTSLKDIAKKVGVSTAVVSSVLNGIGKGKGIRVSTERAKKIRQIAEELNYKPNEIARSLKKGSTKTIGLIVADISNPFFGYLARCIENEALKFGYIVIIGSSDEEINKSDLLIENFLNRQVDGLIIAPSEGTIEQVRNLYQNKIPLVLVDRFFPELSTNYVVLNNYQATFNATSHLIKNGFRRIAIVAYKLSLIHMKDRIRGYLDAMKSYNLSDNISVMEINPKNSKAEITNACMDLFIKNKNIDAIIFTTNLLSVQGLYCITENKIRIPEDLGFIGFDGGDCFNLFNPPLTYVKQPIEEMANEAVKIIMNCVNNAKSSKISQIILDSKLIIRSLSG